MSKDRTSTLDSLPLTQAITPKPKRKLHTLSPELEAMVTIEKALNDLDGPTRRRVLDWLSRRFGHNERPNTLEAGGADK